MSYDRGLPFEQLVALRADLQARSDLLVAAERDFARHKRCAMALERALLRWLGRHRESFGDRFSTHALLRRLPLAHMPEEDKAARRLRDRLSYSTALRRAVIQAVSERREGLSALGHAEAQLTARLHARAFAMASERDWDIPPLDAARDALNTVLSERDAVDVENTAEDLSPTEGAPLMRQIGL